MAYIKDIEDQKKFQTAVLKGNTTPQYKTGELKTSDDTSYTNYVLAQGNGPVKTTNSTKSKIAGVDEDTYNKAYNTPYAESEKSKELNAKRESALSNLESLTSKDSIISDSTWDAINSSFVIPSAVKEADAYLAQQLEKIQSGKTSYSDQVKAMMDKIMNRDKFSYDVDSDPLFQQALASAMNSGKQAMQDTIGQASALTGGYGSTYATSAANQSYNAFIEDAYNNLPEYYQMALEAYQMEGEDMYRQYSMLSAEDDKEFNRYVTAYDATYQHRNRMYDEAYTQYRDSVSDAFATANLEISEHGQLVSDAYNYYNATADYADTVYERDYNSWLDSINIAAKEADILNSDYQKEADRNLTISENQKDRDLTISENVKDREHDSNENLLQREWQSGESEKDRVHQSTENQLQRDFTATENQKDRDLTVSENAKNRAASAAKSGGSGGSGGLKKPTESQNKKALDAYEKEGMEGLNKYLNSVPDNYDRDAIASYVGQYGELPLEQRTYTKTKDTTNWGWGVDNNDVVKDQYGNEFRIDELPKSIQKSLTNLKEGKSYTKK